jgi:Restriction endonuclease BglII
MLIGGAYSFNKGKEVIEKKFKNELLEVQSIVTSINAEEHKNKESKEKTMPGNILYSPKSLNKAFNNEFLGSGWQKERVNCEYNTQQYYVSGYTPSSSSKNQRPFREMDFLKNRVGVEVQFGKYAFMVYNVCAKMTIFHNMNLIEVGIEIVPLKEFADEMSTGVSYFEQIVWDLERRGVADIDIPVLVIGVTK